MLVRTAISGLYADMCQEPWLLEWITQLGAFRGFLYPMQSRFLNLFLEVFQSCHGLARSLLRAHPASFPRVLLSRPTQKYPIHPRR